MLNIIGKMRDVGNRYEAEAVNVADENVKKGLIEVSKYVREISTLGLGEAQKRSVEKKIENATVYETEIADLRNWSVKVAVIRERWLTLGSTVLTNGEHSIVMPGIEPRELVGLKVTSTDPFMALLEIKEKINSYPLSVVSYPTAIDGNVLKIGIDAEGNLIMEAGEHSKKLPIDRVELKEFETITSVDNTGRVITQVPYIITKVGRHYYKLDVTLKSNVGLLYGLFHAIKDELVSVEVDSILEAKSSDGYMGKCYTSSGNTVICKWARKFFKKAKVTYLDVSALWNDKEVLGVIVNAYYRKVVPREGITEGIKGWLITEERARQFSITI